jgi:hypothetical protein
MPWPVGRLLLEENDAPCGRGWENTLARLDEDRADLSERVEPLAEALRQHLLCSEKMTRFYDVWQPTVEELRATLLATDIPETRASERYPLLLSEDEIADELRELSLIAVEELEDGVAAVFSSTGDPDPGATRARRVP